MKRLKLRAGKKDYSFTLPTIFDGSLSFLQGLNLSLRHLQNFFLYFSILIFPISIFFYSANLTGSFVYAFESSVFFTMLIYSIILIGLYLASLILSSEKTFVDPKGFFFVLFFALLTTFSAVMVDPNAANTFGSKDFKLISGISVIIFLTFFYFINLIIRDFSKYRRFFINLFLGSALLSLFILLFSDYQNLTNSNQNQVSLLMLTLLPLNFSFVLFSNRFKLLAVVTLIINFVVLRNIDIDQSESFFLLLTSFIGLLFISVNYLFERLENIFSKFDSIKQDLATFINYLGKQGKFSYTHFSKSITSILNIVFLVLPLFILIIIGIAIIQNEWIRREFDSTFKIYSRIFSTVFSSGDLKVIIFGKGLSAVSTNSPLLVNIFSAQGIFGFVAYLLIMLYGIKLSIANFTSTLKLGDQMYKFAAVSLFYVVTIFVLSIFIYPGFAIFGLWFLFFAISAKLNDLLKGRFLDSYATVIDPKTFRIFDKYLGKKGFLLKGILSILVVMVTILVIFSVYSLKVKLI